MENQLNILKNLIRNKNKELVIDAGGSQDAINDFEWATFEGIDTVDYDQEVLNLILVKTNYNIEDSIILLNKCLDKSLYISEELVIDVINNYGPVV